MRCVCINVFIRTSGCPVDLLKFVGRQSVNVPTDMVSVEMCNVQQCVGNHTLYAWLAGE